VKNEFVAVFVSLEECSFLVASAKAKRGVGDSFCDPGEASRLPRKPNPILDAATELACVAAFPFRVRKNYRRGRDGSCDRCFLKASE
jgi:hypothetical protein